MPTLSSFGGGSARGFGRNLTSAAGPAGVDELFSLFSLNSSEVTITSSGTTPSFGFSITNGFMTAGDASGFAYPLSGTSSLDPTGGVDWLIQATVLLTDRCSDPSIAVWPVTSGRSAPQWNWGVQTSRISAQLNCNSYNGLYGTSIADTGAGSLGTSYYHAGARLTYHFWYAPSIGATKSRLTDSLNDWSVTGTRLGSRSSSISQTFGSSTPVYWGLGSDFDGVSLGTTSTNFTQVRIRSMPSGYNSPGSVPIAP